MASPISCWLVTTASMAYSSAFEMVSREALAMVTALSTTYPVAKGTWMKPARIWGYLVAAMCSTLYITQLHT